MTSAAPMLYRTPMRITTNLPPEIHAIKYVKNSHWIELEDNDGRVHRTHDNALVKYKCSNGDCKFVMLTPSNLGQLLCPKCHLHRLDPLWVRPQVCFVPEQETGFHMPQREGEEETKQ